MEGHDDENVDLAELEANLYAKIHHDAPETVEQYTAAAKSAMDIANQSQQMQGSRVVTKKAVVVNKAGSQTTNSKNGRYWGDGTHQPRAKLSYNKGRLNPFSVANPQGQQTNPSPPQPIIPADYRPKPFTPYTSYISQIGSIDNGTSSSNSIPSTEAVVDAPVPTTRTSQSKKQRKNVLNPFNRLNENKLKRNEKFNVKKEKATKAKAKKNGKPIETINLDTSEDDDDDDVICIPVPPPPLVCIESTDDEEDNEKQQNNSDDNAVIPEDFIGQRDRSRISQSIDDDALGGMDDHELLFICDTVESALRCQEFETSDKTNDIMPKKNSKNTSPVNASELERDSTVCEDDSVVFATPQKSNATNTGKATYEVSEHGFAAVDVYESESSDFPESVYAKGAQKSAPEIPRVNESDSDCSEIQINTHNRSKRMLKRKSSTSNKGSDYKTDDGGESDDGVPFLEIYKDTSTPYLQRGEAVNNAKFDKHKSKVTSNRKSAVEKLPPQCEQSDEEFFSMLSCIVHDNPHNDSALNSTEEDPNSSNTKDESSSIDARQVVEHVLKKMSKSAVPQSTEKESWVVTDEVGPTDVEDEIIASTKEIDLPEEADAANKEGKSSQSWIVKDQIGETDNFAENIIPIIDKPVASVAEIEKTTTDDVSIISAKPNEPNKSDKTDNQCVRSCSLAVDPEIGWNDEMKRFYNDSWGGESFNVPAIQRDMPHRRSYEWAIVPDDKLVERRHHNRNVRCINCREEGHRMQNCYMPPKQIKCHMCGQTGHREPRCPQKMCLRCGRKNGVFSRGCNSCQYMQNLICSICKTRGHGVRECPDKWRRYHSTIEAGPLKKLPMLINKPRYCCICAVKGHTAEYCRNALRILDTPMAPTHINSYIDVYDPINQSTAVEEESARFALMSAPVENVQFSWDVDESPNRFYGRFLTSTNIVRQPVKKKKHRKENSVQMVINPMSTINQDLKKRKKTFTKNFYEDKSSVPNIVTQNAPETFVVPTVQDEIEQNSFTENGDETNNTYNDDIECTTTNENDKNVNNLYISFTNPVEALIPTSDALTNTPVDVPSGPNIKRKPEPRVERTHHQDEYDEPQSKRERSQDPKQTSECLENEINFSFTKTLNDCLDITPNKFNLDNIFHKSSSNSVKISTPLFNASNDWINANFLNESAENVSEESLNNSNRQTHHLTMDTKANFIRSIDEAIKPFNQRHSTPNKELPGKRFTTKEKSLRNINVAMNRQSPPQAPSPPTMLGQSDEIAAEVRRLDQSEKFLENLRQTLSKKRSSPTEDTSFVVSLNEDVEEATRKAKRIRFDSDSNYSFSEYFEQSGQFGGLSDSDKESTSIDDTGSNPDFIPLNNDSANDEEIVEDNIQTDIRQMVEEDPIQSNVVLEKSKIYLSKEHCKYLLTRSGNEFLTNANSKHGVIVRMEWRSVSNILIVEGTTSAQDNFHQELISYCEAAVKTAHLKRITSQKLPKNRLSLIKFIKDQISQLESSHGNVKDLYLRMCMHEKQNSKNNNRNADRIRRLLNMILMGQTGLREGPMHLRLLQSNLKSLMSMTKMEVANQMRDAVFSHYQYIFSPVEHSDYPGLLCEYEAIRKQKQRPVMKLDRSLLGLKIDVTFPAEADAASDHDEKKSLLSVNKTVEGHAPVVRVPAQVPAALIEAVKRMKKNNDFKTETN